MPRGGLVKVADGQPKRLEMLGAQHELAVADQTAGEGLDAHEPAGQHLEQMLVERRADLDG